MPNGLPGLTSVTYSCSALQYITQIWALLICHGITTNIPLQSFFQPGLQQREHQRGPKRDSVLVQAAPPIPNMPLVLLSQARSQHGPDRDNVHYHFKVQGMQRNLHSEKSAKFNWKLLSRKLTAQLCQVLLVFRQMGLVVYHYATCCYHQ